MIRCILVDDEPLALEVLENYVERVSELQLVRKCDDALQAFEILHKEPIDLIFLDIQMPVIDGLGFLKSLKNPPAVILTTAFPQHAVESYNLNVVDFLLKPISFERFLKAFNKVKEKSNVTSQSSHIANVNYIFLKVDSKLLRINFSEMLFVEGMKDYLKIYLKDKMLVVHQTMKSLEESLPPEMFRRVHKSYIVSLSAVRSVTGNFIEIADKEVPIGANYKEELLSTILKSKK